MKHWLYQIYIEMTQCWASVMHCYVSAPLTRPRYINAHSRLGQIKCVSVSTCTVVFVCLCVCVCVCVCEVVSVCVCVLVVVCFVFECWGGCVCVGVYVCVCVAFQPLLF